MVTRPVVSELDKPNLRNFTQAELKVLVAELGLPSYRADQIFRWVHSRQIDSFDEMTDLDKALRHTLSEKFSIRNLDIDLEQVSRDGTRKLRLRTEDARLIETVLIPGNDATEEDDAEEIDPRATFDRTWRRPKLTQCISSQVGCALDCSFCATAKLGFGRQLTAGEIVDQVYRATRLIDALPEDDVTRRVGSDHITNVVFMGMGEPLHNYSNVMRAIDILSSPLGGAIARRRITVSTAGLVPAIEKFAREPLRPSLAISLNATTDEVRNEVMPINRKWNIARLLEAVRLVPLDRKRRITFEYVLLGGVNDTLADARRLPRLIAGIPAKVNLIAWNPHQGAAFSRPSDDSVERFQNELKRAGLAVYLRRSRGDDIDAACGQLAARKPELHELRVAPAL